VQVYPEKEKENPGYGAWKVEWGPPLGNSQSMRETAGNNMSLEHVTSGGKEGKGVGSSQIWARELYQGRGGESQLDWWVGISPYGKEARERSW